MICSRLVERRPSEGADHEPDSTSQGRSEKLAPWRTARCRYVSYVSILKVVPADLAASSDRHREVACQIDSALDTDAPVVAAMPAAYGTVGAVFTAAIDDFEAGVTRTGSALACDYRRMSEALNMASASYLGVDQASEVAVARSAAFIDAVVPNGTDIHGDGSIPG
jgi:Excreted virulence factor EspC, type VII ESX diderm